MPIVRPEQRRVGFLGFGMMAKAPALVLKSLGFPVSAWVRSPRQAAGGPDLPRPRSARAVSRPDRHRRLPAAADAGNRGHLLRAHVCHDAEGRHAGECRARQACGGQGPDRRARFGTVVLRRVGRAVARAAAAGKPALAASQGYRDAARGAAADRRATGHRDRREHPQPRGRRAAPAGGRHHDGVPTATRLTVSRVLASRNRSAQRKPAI